MAYQTFELPNLPFKVVTTQEAWDDLGRIAAQNEQHFAFYPTQRDGHIQWRRSANGGDVEDCDVGIPVDELVQTVSQPSTCAASSKLDGTISSPILDRIPVEIFDHIIDHIPYSHLPVAALVARSWYASVVHNLYRTLELGSREEYMSFAARLHSSPRVQRWAMGAEEIIIGKPLCKPASGHDVFLDLLPAALVNWLPSLCKLTIHSELRSRMQTCFYAGVKQFRHIVCLRLTDIELDHIGALQKVIHCFPFLTTLSLARLRIVSDTAPTRVNPLARSRVARPSIRLQSLTLEYVERASLQRVVDWLVHSKMCTRLERFAVTLQGVARKSCAKEDPSIPEFEQIIEILRDCETSLKSFTDESDRAHGSGKPPGRSAAPGNSCKDEDAASLEVEQIQKVLQECGTSLKLFIEEVDHTHGLGFPHCSLEDNTDLRYLKLQTYISLDVDDEVPEVAALAQYFPHMRPGLTMPAQLGLADKWAWYAEQLHADLVTMESHRLEHLVIQINVALFDLYLKQDVRQCMDIIRDRMHAEPRVHELMRRRRFNRLRCVDVILDMRHDQLPHKLCMRWTPKSVDPVVQELFRPWCARGIVKFSKFFRLPVEP